VPIDDQNGSQGRSAPPVVTGRRSTDSLSPRAVRAIKDAAAMAVINKTPLRSFYTFTIRAEDRAPFLTGDRTVGSEMRRFLVHLRQRVSGDLPYLWVAECPANAAGDPNLHVHLLTSYSVPRSDFAQYAAWCEARWGLGFVHMERIKFPEAAGRYMLKAVGYVAKGSEPDSGSFPIFGRRYSISQDLRAPETVEYLDLDTPSKIRSVAEIFGGSPRVYGSGYFTGNGIVYPVGTGVAELRRDALRLVRYGAAIVFGIDSEGIGND